MKVSERSRRPAPGPIDPTPHATSSTASFVDGRRAAAVVSRLQHGADQALRTRSPARAMADGPRSRPGILPGAGMGGAPVQMREARYKESKLLGARWVDIEKTNNGFDAIEVSGALRKTREEVGYLTFKLLEGDRMASPYPILADVGPVVDLIELKAEKPGVGSLLMHTFASWAAEKGLGLFISNATREGPAYYQKLGFRMVNWIFLPHRREGLPRGTQDALGSLEESRMRRGGTGEPYEGAVAPYDHLGADDTAPPTQGSMVMYAGSAEVLANLRERVARYWRVSK